MNTDKIIPMFVFGTLMSQTTLDMLGVAPTEKQNATLPGFRKSGLNILEEEGSNVPGHYFQVDEHELKVLDRYESIDSVHHGYYRFLVNVKTDDGWKRAYAYKVKGTL